VFVAAEAVTDCQDRITECVHRARAHAHATTRADHPATAERTKREDAGPDTADTARVPSTPPATPAGPVPIPDPDRAAPALADRTAVRTADRAGSAVRNGLARTQPGTAPPGSSRSDAQLARAVRELAERIGGPPSQYTIKQRLGVGSGRAARLLAELASTPAGAPASNGAATGKETVR